MPLIFNVLGLISWALWALSCTWPPKVNFMALGLFFFALAYLFPSL
jgi:hypothetical protein